MRIFSNLFALSPSLLLWTLTTLVDASSLAPLQPTPQLPFPIPHQLPQDDNASTWLSRARDVIIQTIWRIPSDHGTSNVNCKGSKKSGPPSTLVARYGGDLVLRFEINSIEEAKALAEAINVLFLDVWEFTTGWVDIRLSKDVVSNGHCTNFYSTNC